MWSLYVPGRQVDHSALSGYGVTNELRYTNALPGRLHCVPSDDRTAAVPAPPPLSPPPRLVEQTATMYKLVVLCSSKTHSLPYPCLPICRCL